MSELVPSGSKYTDDDRMKAVVTYAVMGSGAAVSRETGIPERTILDWRKSDWFNTALAEVRAEKQDEYIAQYDKLITEGTRIALDKLPDASARDAMIIAATANDKLRLALNQPTSISASSKGIDDLKRQFEELSANHKRIEGTIVDEQ